MALKIDNITAEAHQRHTIALGESEITLSLRYHPTVEMWVMDIEYNGIQAHGYKLTTGVLHMQSRNLPFDFVVSDNSNQGLDPVRLDDFEMDRCTLYMLEADEMETFRGAPVPI